MKSNQPIYSGVPRYSDPLIVTGIAILAVLAAVIILAILLGEFAWNVAP